MTGEVVHVLPTAPVPREFMRPLAEARAREFDGRMDTYTKPEPVRVMSAILSGLSFIFGGLATVSGFADNPTIAIVAGVGTLITGGAALAIGEYTRGKTVPYADTSAFRNETGETVAGPASTVPDGEPAAVVSV